MVDVFGMNVWYFAAILLGALSAFCAYHGASIQGRKSSEEHTSRIEGRLEELGNQIADYALAARTTASNDGELEAIDNKYVELAKQYFGTLPLKSAEEQERIAREKVSDLKKRQAVAANLRAIYDEAKSIATAYSAANAAHKIEANGYRLESFASDDVGQMPIVLISIDSSGYWAIRAVSYPDGALAIQFVRVVPTTEEFDIDKLALTNDSINFFTRDARIHKSVNSKISTGVQSNIANAVDERDMAERSLVEIGAIVVQRLIEYELLKSAS